MPEETYKEIRRFIVQSLAKGPDEEIARLEKEKGWTPETHEQWGREHMRTPYKTECCLDINRNTK